MEPIRLPGSQPGLFASAINPHYDTLRSPASLSAVVPLRASSRPAPSGEAAQPAEAAAQPRTVSEERIALAEELGEREDRVRIMRPDWQALTRRVVVVDLTIGYYRSRHRLTSEDLGLTEAQRNDPEFAEALREVVSLGNKKLLPELFGKAEEIESQARYAVEKVSLRSGFGHLVPRAAYPDLRQRLEQLRDDFFALRDLIEASYNELAPQILERFRKIGRGALAQQMAAGLVVEDPESWIEDYARKHLALLPPREVIAASFTFEWAPAYLAPSSEIVEDEALAEKRRLEAQIENELLRAKAQGIRLQEDFDYRQKELELQAVRQEREREEQLAAEIARARRDKQLELINGTFKDISCQLHEAVYDVCLDVLEAMKRKGKVVRNSSRQLRGLVEKLRLLNVCDDAELEAIARQVEAIVQSDSKRRDSRAIGEVLAEVGMLTRAQLLAAGRSPRSGLAVSIPDTIDVSRRAGAARRIAAAPVSFELAAVRRRGRRLAGQESLALPA